jgi:hypothetical protein
MTKQNLVSDLEAATPGRLASPRTAESCLTIPMLATCFEVFVMRLWHGLELRQNPMWGKLSTLQSEVRGKIMLVVPLSLGSETKCTLQSPRSERRRRSRNPGALRIWSRKILR